MAETALPIAVVFATALLSCLATRGLIPLLCRLEVLDRPNERSSHLVATPRGGGIAVIGTVLLAWAALDRAGRVPPGVIAILLGAGLLAVVCWIDDVRGLSPGVRLLAQGAAVAIGLIALSEAPCALPDELGSALCLMLTGLLWVWWINLFNFMDGIDGLAGSEAASIGAGLLLFATVGAGVDSATAPLAAAIIGATVGFLVWNWSPARIFLGDVGSVPLGYLLGFLLIALAARGRWQIALILPLYFLADATITLARRVLHGDRVWRPHREHYYQQAIRRGLDHAAVVKRVIAADLLLIVCGWTAENGLGLVALAAAVAIASALLMGLARGR
jgi:UDP-N-acetylmuramyl pentapeptide phosphotransferase/UDP-N-acetylglucosamine-1-phosphate transferase